MFRAASPRSILYSSGIVFKGQHRERVEDPHGSLWDHSLRTYRLCGEFSPLLLLQGRSMISRKLLFRSVWSGAGRVCCIPALEIAPSKCGKWTAMVAANTNCCEHSGHAHRVNTLALNCDYVLWRQWWANNIITTVIIDLMVPNWMIFQEVVLTPQTIALNRYTELVGSNGDGERLVSS